MVAHGREDVLITAIGRPQLPGHVHVVGVDVPIRKYFGPTSAELDRLKQNIKEELTQNIWETTNVVLKPNAVLRNCTFY